MVSDEQKSLVFHRLGFSYSQTGDAVSGLEWYSKQIELNRRDRFHAHCLFNRGGKYLNEMKYAAALADYNQAQMIYTDPKDLADCFWQCAAVCRALGFHEMERAELQKGVRLITDPKEIQDYYFDRLKELNDLRQSGSSGGVAVDSKRKSESLPLCNLSVAGVSDYLRSIAPAYAAYIQSFADNGINGAALCKLTDSELVDLLGVSNKLHRIRLLSDIKSARSASRSGTGTGTGAGMCSLRIEWRMF